MYVIPALKRLRSEDDQEFRVIVGYEVRLSQQHIPQKKEIPSFVNVFDKYLIDVLCVPHAVPGSRARVVNQGSQDIQTFGKLLCRI